MAETAPNLESGSPQFAVTMDKNGRPRVYTKENADAPKRPLKEVDLLESVNHNLKERENYNMGFEDAKAEGTKIDVTVEEEPSPDINELVTEGYPKKATWHAHDGDHEVTVTGSWGVGGDGQVYYQIGESETGVPAAQLEFSEEPEASLEETRTTSDKSEKEKTKEKWTAKEKALHPETIIRLKEKFDERLKAQMKDLESLRKTGRLAELYEKAEKSTADLLRAAVLSEYLDSLSDEERAEVEPLWDSLIHEMEMDYEALEILRGMMRDGETEREPWPGEEPKAALAPEEPTVIKPEPLVVKPTPVSGAPDTPEAAAASDDAAETVSYTWNPRVGDQVAVKRGDGVIENDWTIRKIYEKDGEKRIMASQGPENGGPYQAEVDQPFDEFLQWQLEANSSGKPEDKEAKKKASIWERVKDYASGRKAKAWFDTRGTPRKVVVEEVEEEYEEDRRSRLGVALGALTAGVAIGYAIDLIEDLLERKHGMPKAGVGTAIKEHGHSAGHIKEHLDTWNSSSSGHRYEQSILPNNLEQGPLNGVAGTEHIIDKNTGQTLVEHVTYKANGVYSDDTIRQLHDAGYNTQVTQNPIFDTDGGPGPVGDVEGRWTTVVTPT